jgi:hypothetical protein
MRKRKGTDGTHCPQRVKYQKKPIGTDPSTKKKEKKNGNNKHNNKTKYNHYAPLVKGVCSINGSSSEEEAKGPGRILKNSW